MEIQIKQAAKLNCRQQFKDIEIQRVANDVNVLALYIFYFLLLTDHDVGMFCSENIDNHLVTKENNLTKTNH